MKSSSMRTAMICAAFLGLGGAALAQSSGGMNGASMNGGAAKGGGMTMNAQGGFDIFSRENMAMMIVDREKATKGMTVEQAAAARKKEMAKDQAESPDQRQARKARYDAEWLKLTAAEKSDALAKWDTQLAKMKPGWHDVWI